MFTHLINFFISLADHYGVYGVGVGMAFESLGIPFGGIAMVLAAIPLVQQGKASYLGIIIIGTIGTTIGSLISYYIGYYFGKAIRKFRHGNLFNREDILDKFVDKYGEGAVFFAQLFGASRSFISLPAGMVRLNLKKFLIGTIAGSLIINSTMVVADIYLYKTWQDVSNYFGVPMWFSLVFSAIFLAFFFLLYKKRISELIKNGNHKSKKAKKYS